MKGVTEDENNGKQRILAKDGGTVQQGDEA